MTTETKSPVFEEVFQNIRKLTEANLKMQQEVYSQLSSLWPGIPTPHSAWVSKVQQFRSQLANSITEMAREHKKVVDAQYASALESLEAAMSVVDAGSPEELRRKTEQLCRKSLDCVREVSESQVRELQEVVTKMTDLMAKAGS